METLIRAVLTNYIPTVIIAGVIVGIFAIAFAGVIRNSGRLDDVARSNQIIQTVIVGIIMLFVSGLFVFAFHKVYVSQYYGGIEQQLSANLSQAGNSQDTSQLQGQIGQTGTDPSQPQCINFIISPFNCIKQVINQTIAAIISTIVRAVGSFIDTVIKYLNSSFPFLFNLPAQLYDNSGGISSGMIANFNLLLKFSEVIGLAFVYLLMVTHYFKSIMFSLDQDYSSDFIGDIGKMLLAFAGVFLARYLAEAIILTAQAFASFLFNNQLATGLTSTLQTLISQGLWNSFGSFGISLVVLAIFVLVYIILFGFLVFKNAKRYFILLVMILLAPIFTPLIFFEETRNMGSIFWTKFFTTSFSLMFDLLILSMVFIFLGSGGLSLGNLLLILVGMAVVADSNNLIAQIANASEVAGFRSVVRSGIRSGAGLYYRFKRLTGSNNPPSKD